MAMGRRRQEGQQRELFVASSEIRALDRNRFDEFAEETLLETEGLRRVHVRGQEEIRNGS